MQITKKFLQFLLESIFLLKKEDLLSHDSMLESLHEIFVVALSHTLYMSLAIHMVLSNDTYIGLESTTN